MALTPQASTSNLRKRKLLPSPQPEQPNDDDGIGIKVEEEEKDPKVLKPDLLKLWNYVNDQRVGNNVDIVAVFRKLPSKRQYPDYYAVIKRPMALEDIRTDIYNLKYTTLTAMRDDMLLVFRNAMRYNAKDSQIWLDAKYLKKHLLDQYDIMMGRVKEPEVKKPKRTYTLVKWNFRALRLLNEITDTDDRHRLEIFQELPDRDQYPDYYVLIKRPMSVKEIKKKIHRREYQNVEEFTQDVNTMFSNALFYNEDTSQVHEDASILQKAFDAILAEAPSEFDPPTAEELGHTGDGVKREASQDADSSKNVKGGKSFKLNLPAIAPHSAQLETPTKISVTAPIPGKIKIKAPGEENVPPVPAPALKDNAKSSGLAPPTSALPRHLPPSANALKPPLTLSPVPLPTVPNGLGPQNRIADTTTDMSMNGVPALVEAFVFSSSGVDYRIETSSRTRSHALAIQKVRAGVRMTVVPSTSSNDSKRQQDTRSSSASTVPSQIALPTVSVWTNGVVTPPIIPGQGEGMTSSSPGAHTGQNGMPTNEKHGTSEVRPTQQVLEQSKTTDSTLSFNIRMGKGLTVVEVETSPASSSFIPGLGNGQRTTTRYRIFVNQF